jgi:hypothetical protein
MNSLVLPATKNTPHVCLDASSGVFELRGRSTPENPSEYYAQINRWVDTYLQQPSDSTIVRLFFEYFNTSSSKCLLELMKRLTALQQGGKKISFQWIYEHEDDDMREAGADFKDILKAPFEIIAQS